MVILKKVTLGDSWSEERAIFFSVVKASVVKVDDEPSKFREKRNEFFLRNKTRKGTEITLFDDVQVVFIFPVSPFLCFLYHGFMLGENDCSICVLQKG